MGGIVGRFFSYTILLASLLVWNGASRAEMAIAMGTTGDVYKDGYVWGGGFGADGRKTALEICRGFKAPEVGELPTNATRSQKLCKIVTVFQDKCFAVSQDGTARTAAHGMGWSVAADLKSAEAEALVKCEVMTGRARHEGCRIEYSHCDGAAK